MTAESNRYRGDERRFFVGIDAGSVSVNCIVVDRNGDIVYEAPYRRHKGKIVETAAALLRLAEQEVGGEKIGGVAFTGNNGKNLAGRLGCLYEFETITQVAGSVHLVPGVRSIISMGGQDTALFQVGYPDGNSAGGLHDWELEHFNTNGPCASGTGSFIDQQAERLATSLYSASTGASESDIDSILSEFIALGLKSESPAQVACRCTVFTKSDMIHLQNKGERLEDIISGLHIGNARNYISTIVCGRIPSEPVVFIGGLSLNALQVRAFKDYFPGLVVPPHATSAGALGAALFSAAHGAASKPVTSDMIESADAEGLAGIPTGRPLRLKLTSFTGAGVPGPVKSGAKGPFYLAIDIGSTTTKHVVMDERLRIVHKNYVHTKGKPIEVTQQLLQGIIEDLGPDIDIRGVATTGSGRSVVGDFLNADLIVDEITAHARGAVEIDPDIDTIFEIGGQDSKYISLVNGRPLDFDMNKVCAAGTGSFLHELANKYGINIVEEFERIALSSEHPVKLAERCTVFMESDLVSYLQRGANRVDLFAGLCYAVVHNYLNRVVGKRHIGKRVMFLGGPSLNKAVVAAFEQVLGRGLLVPAHREVMGAFGAALGVMEQMVEQGGKSLFRGLSRAVSDRMQFTEKICTADPNCHNRCKLKIYDFDGRKSIWGGECGRYELSRIRGVKKENYFEIYNQLWLKHMEGVFETLGEEPVTSVDGRPTVGMQRALYGYETSVLWAHFFDRLGFRLVLTPPTNPLISKIGIEAVTAETCYPVKVSLGHVKTLLGKTALLFLPSIISVEVANPGEIGFFCPMVQGNSYITRAALDIDMSSVLNPVIHLNQDTSRLAQELYEQMGKHIGAGKSRIESALNYAKARQAGFHDDLIKAGRRFFEELNAGTPGVIVTGRPYNLYDEKLNLRLGRSLSKLGLSAIPMDFVDCSGVDISDFPSMYWGLGARILRTAKMIGGASGLYGLHLTNFGCGADSFLEHFYKYCMGEKPYLILELDEHSGVAGVMTRLEAFKNVVYNSAGVVPGKEQEPRFAN
ncbi:MAG: acyl-CoA dehydratase activase [Desulfatiglandaceae bacterium]